MDAARTPLDRAIELCGGRAALARKIGRSRQIIAFWQTKAKKGVPPEAAIEIEEAVEGKVTRHELRPDLADIFGRPERAA